jgi:transmembrane sensor
VSNPIDIQAEELIIRFLSRKATSEEVSRLRFWLSESTIHQRSFDEICDVWLATATVYRKNDFLSHKAWIHLNIFKSFHIQSYHIFQKKKDRTIIHWQWIAAIFILSFIAGSVMTYEGDKNKSKSKNFALTEHHVPYGSKSFVTLPDGTRVWINSGSRLWYSQQFNAIDRQVMLEGEAYFDVSKNIRKPFFVKTSRITVKVLGTAFNVKAYPDEKTIETTVERGLVQLFSNVSAKHKVQTVFLHPKQKAVYVKNPIEMHRKSISADGDEIEEKEDQYKLVVDSIVVANNVVTEWTTSWKDNRWIVDREKLKDLAIKIERRYNVKIDFTEPKIREYVFSGVLEDESLEQVLEVIILSAPVRYSLKQKRITFFENNTINTLTH